MTDYKFVPLNNLENRLGNALGLAIAMIRKPETVDNKTMAQIAAALRAAADQMGSHQSKKFLYSIADAMKLRDIAAELEGAHD
jgi:hypothetical protein